MLLITFKPNTSEFRLKMGTNTISQMKSPQPLLTFGVNIYSGFSLLPSATQFRQGYIFTGVCDSVHKGVSQHALGQTPPRQTLPPGRHPAADTPSGRHPLGRHPPGQTPPRQTPPWADTPWADTPLGRHPQPTACTAYPAPSQWPLQWTVCILLECVLVMNKNAPTSWTTIISMLESLLTTSTRIQ